MTKVLSIDLDYIMGPTIETYQHKVDGPNPSAGWAAFYDSTDFKENQFFIDQGNLIYCYNTFLKALSESDNPKVLFGYDHDAILYLIGNEKNIDIVNIDHHDDVLHGEFLEETPDYMKDDVDHHLLEREVEYIKRHHQVNEGNWGAWLELSGKLDSFTWIHSEHSGNIDRNSFTRKFLGDKFSNHVRQDYEFDDYEFDHIFVCLSPLYVPKTHWHYFTMFVIAYEEFCDEDATIVSDRKFEWLFNNMNTHETIIQQKNIF